MNEEGRNNEEKKNKGFAAFVKRNKVRLAAAALVLVAGTGIGAFFLSKNENDISTEPGKSTETPDPDYTPDASQNIIIGGEVIGSIDPENPIVKPDDKGEDYIEFEVPGNHIQEESQAPIDPEPSETHLFHTFGEWTNYKEMNAEIRTCSVCDYVEIRDHTLNEIKTDYYTATTHSDKENGEHYKVETQTCSTCDYVSVKTTKEDCTFSTVTYDSSYHYLRCTGCEQSYKLKHTLDNGTVNPDGTISYACTYEGCNYVKMTQPTNTINPIKPDLPNNSTGNTNQTHSHTFTRMTKEENLNNGTHRISSYDVCSTCGEKRLVSSNIYDCSYENPTTVYTNLGENGHSYITTSTCTVCGSEEIVKGNENHHKTTTIDANGNTIVTCSECSYKKLIENEKPSVPIEHNHTLGNAITTYEDLGNGTHRTKTVVTCTASDCDKSAGWTKTTYGNPETHTTITTTDANGNKVISCTTCSYKKVIENEKPPVEDHVHDYEEITETTYNGNNQHTTTIYNVCKDPNCTGDDKKVQVSQISGACSGTTNTTYETTDSGHTVVTTTTCSICGNTEVQKTNSPHSYTIDTNKTDAAGNKIYACICGHEMAISQECQHQWGPSSTNYKQIDGTNHSVIVTHACTICGKSEIVSETTAACTHDITEVGLTKTESCGTCGYVYSTHTHIEKTISEGYDSTSCGYETVICSECNQVLTARHSIGSHNMVDYGEKDGIIQPTICANHCGYTSERIVLPYTLRDDSEEEIDLEELHNWKNYEIEGEPEATEEVEFEVAGRTFVYTPIRHRNK